MGFYIRKAFKVGPLRLNLSKHGFGVSGGVTGARLGISSDGRLYTHAGRHGLYYRKYFSKNRQTTKRKNLSKNELFEDTGVTFSSTPLIQPDQDYEIEDEASSGSMNFFFKTAAGIIAVLFFILVFINHAAAFIFLIISLVSGASAGIYINIKRKTLIGKSNEFINIIKNQINSAPASEIKQQIRLYDLFENIKKDLCEDFYLETLNNIIEDRKVSRDEKALLDKLRQSLSLDQSFCDNAAADVYKRIYAEAVADHEFSVEEENTLTGIRESLQIKESDIKEEKEMLEMLKKMRQIRKGRLEKVVPGYSFLKDRNCYFKQEARLLNLRIIRRFQRDNVKYKVRGFRLDREGTLLVTDDKIIMVHTGTTSIPVKKIVDIETDYDSSIIKIIKEGRKTPIYFTLPDTLKAGAVIQAVCERKS